MAGICAYIGSQVLVYETYVRSLKLKLVKVILVLGSGGY